MRLLFTTFLAIASLAATPLVLAKVIYVDADNGAPAPNGGSWAAAFPSLQNALTLAQPGDEIWVAAGTYTPRTPNNDRIGTFRLKNGVGIYGGFSGTEGARNERNTGLHTAILSGDLYGDDTNGAHINDNAYHVVFAENVDATAILDGFTIIGGNANAREIPHNRGGGMIIIRASPSVIGCTFLGNRARTDGGGIALIDSSATIVNCIISDNTAGQNGGGMFNQGASTPAIINCTFHANSAGLGGAIANVAGSTPAIANSIMWGNHPSDEPQIFNLGGMPVIRYCDIQGSGGSAQWDTFLGINEGHNIDVDPAFVNAATGDYRICAPPVIDRGFNAVVPPGIMTDINGHPRVIDNISVANAPPNAPTTIDLGATEAPADGRYLIYVNAKVNGGMNVGNSWAHALSDLQTALSMSPLCVAEIWVAAGIYTPDAGGGQTPGDRDASFLLRPNWALYGGFAGGESSREQRNPARHVTILSGDLDGDDEGFQNNDENSFRVLVCIGADETTILDGFTISGGHASRPQAPGNAGAGISLSGGGMTLRNCRIINNMASLNGGGVFLNMNAAPAISNCIIADNSAANGGGVYVNNNSSPTMLNCTITGNQAGFGGGLVNFGNSRPVIRNSIIWGNRTTDAGPEIRNLLGSEPRFSFCDLGGSGGSHSWNNVFGINEGGNIDSDPLFAGAAFGDYRVCNSPVIDAGNDMFLPPDLSVDILGNPRIFDHPNIANSGPPMSSVDMGAVEFPGASTVILHVDANADDGRRSGLSWSDAFANLQDALTVIGHCPAEVWVTAGIYRPDTGGQETTGARAATFRLRNGVAIYGGFAGSEIERDQRDPEANVTILSGDLNGDDDIGNRTDNSYHIITARNVGGPGVVVDGFVVTGGHANGAPPFNSGGAIFLDAGRPTIRNCRFFGNHASGNGGAIFAMASAPAIVNSIFVGNTAGAGGGAMFNTGGSSPTVTNCTFTRNNALFFGGMSNNNGTNAVIGNSIFWANTDNAGSGLRAQLNDTPDSPTSIAFSLVQGWPAPGVAGMIKTDPLFIDADGVDNRIGTVDDNLRLSINSKAIDAGNNSVDTDAITPGLQALHGSDLAGKPRFIDWVLRQDVGLGTPPIVDMGAYEFVPDIDPGGIFDNSAAPIVVAPIADISVAINAEPTVVELSNRFSDPDSDDTQIILKIAGSGNPELIAIALKSTTLTISYFPDRSGVTNVTIRAVSGGKSVDDTFSVTIRDGFSLDVDNNGVADALTDGLLITRYLHGRRNAALTDRVIDVAAKRVQGQDVEIFLDDAYNAESLDINNDALQEAIPDGYLILRFLFGFRGQALTAGICPDCDINQVTSTLDALMP